VAPINFRTLDLNLLRVFDEVMAERNLTRAAEKLALTQPAVSNALRRLREVVGDDLLVRSGQGVEPTPRALALWPTVRQALGHLQQALAPGAFDPGTASTAFVLAMADATGATLIPPLVEIVEREAPGVSLRVVPLTTRDPRRLLDDETADVAVGYFPAAMADLTARAQTDSLVAFDSMRLYDGEYVCVMRRGHPLAHGPLALDQYCAARHLLVSFSGKPFGFIDEALAAPIVHVDALWHRRRRHDPAHRWLQDALARSARRTFHAPPLP
jgi:DNA-binding transcriptional LysR family regulator